MSTDVSAPPQHAVDALDRCVIAVMRARRVAARQVAAARRAAHLPARDIPAENATMAAYRAAFGDADGAALGAAVLRISSAPTAADRTLTLNHAPGPADPTAGTSNAPC